MTVSREPGLPVFARRRPPEQAPAPSSSAELARAALSAVGGGDYAHAVLLLDRLLDDPLGPDRAGLPTAVEEELRTLADDSGLAGEVRAAAAAARGRSRLRNGDRAGAVADLDRARALAPTPGRIAAWADLATGPVDPAQVAEILDAALERFPDAASLAIRAAEAALSRSELDRARALLRPVLAEAPRDARALTALARLELEAGRPEAALDLAGAAVSERPSRSRSLLAIALHRVGRLDTDPGLLAAVLTAPPDELWELRHLAEVLLERDQVADAIVVLDHALTVHPDDVVLRIHRGSASARIGDLGRADEDLERAAADGAAGEWLTALRGEVARLRGDPGKAVSLLAALDELTRPAWVSSALGLAYTAVRAFEDAYVAYQSALARDPDDVAALCGAAERDLELRGEDGAARAETALLHALEIEPHHARAHALLGEVYRRSDRSEMAVTSFDEALAAQPDFVYALASKGQALVALGERARAVPLLEHAVRLAPAAEWILDALVEAIEATSPADAERLLRRMKRELQKAEKDVTPLQLRRARLAGRRKRWADADKLYGKVRKKAPDDPALAWEHAVALQELGRRVDALDIVDELARSTDDASLSWLRIELCWELDRLDEVRADLERLVDGPEPPTAAVAALGELRRIEGRRPEARRLLERARRSVPDDAYALASLGALEWDEGAVDAARQALRKAIEIVPGYGFAIEKLVELESDRGEADALRSLLDDSDAEPSGRALVLARARGCSALGDYGSALRILDDYLEAVGDEAEILRSRGWVEVARGRPRRAAESFLAAFAAARDRPAGLVADVAALTRVDCWKAVQDLLASVTSREGDAELARAMAAMRTGEVGAAAAHAVPVADQDPTHYTAALLAAHSLRYLGRLEEALARARALRALYPNDLTVGAELGECLWSAGQTDAARGVFADLVTRLERRVHLDPDEMNLRGWTLFRLGRTGEAAEVFLRTLRKTDQRAEVLVNLVLVSFADRDLREARILERRALEELAHLSPASQRGMLTATVRDLDSIDARLEPAERAAAADLAVRLAGRRDALSVADIRASLTRPIGVL